MSVVLMVGVLLITIWLTNGLVLFPLRLVHLPNLPFWLDWAIAIAVLSWFIGD